MLARDPPPAPPSPEQQALFDKIRRRMLLSGFATLIGIAAVLGVIAYKVLHGGGSAPSEVTALLPRGARIVSTAVSADRVIVTLDVGGATEIRSFDARSLAPAGRLKFAVEP
jgi:hypothetical protein